MRSDAVFLARLQSGRMRIWWIYAADLPSSKTFFRGILSQLDQLVPSSWVPTRSFYIDGGKGVIGE